MIPVITEQRTRKCSNCAFGRSIMAGKMYCIHPFHYGKNNEPTHHCNNWKDRRHGVRDESD